ncbi:sensor histidine kinase [Amycolatopsis saalfeldensis]|uniref:histidine kinase n=1 Tax=Amycolatopsis saalfeldensis TaxID=394193 RepID=A0A1H8Y6Z2_9PSEU|nr:histidine kinase [Amycolatopsis saalfeldensis]SEP47857.1 Signal transduction histidine kinase [Amycolatopsis saalfeldensis]
MKEAARRWRSVVFDVLAWFLLSLLVVIDASNNPSRWELAGGLVAVAVAAVTLRRYPTFALAVTMSTAVVVAVGWGGRVAVWEVFFMVAMAYRAGLRTTRVWLVAVVCGGIVLAGLPVALLVPAAGLEAWAGMLGVMAFAAVTPWLLGRFVRTRGALSRTGWRLAAEMESRQRLVADQARLRERARIASDMHDSLGHELSLIAVRAAALEVAGGLAEPQRTAAGELRESAATATERLREIIGVLREDAAPVEPVQGDLGELVDRARASGLLIQSQVDDLVAAPPMVARAAYRVLQEALTNVAKHAPGAAVTVRVLSSAETTEVRVLNAAPPAGPLPGASGRRGLIGLRERVRLVGGTLHAGPRTGELGGFELVARLPHDAAPVEETPESRDAAEAVVGPSTAARELELARRDVRRSLVQAIVIPLLMFGVVIAGGGLVFLVQWSDSELPMGAYQQLRIGAPRASFAGLLPARQRIAKPLDGEPPVPPGANCEYYGTGRSWTNSDYAVYRLCFVDGRLVEKDYYSEDRR